MARLHGVETDYASLRRMLLGNYTLDNEDEYEQVRELLAERDRLREDLQRIWTASFNTPESMQAFVRDLGRRRWESWGLDPSVSRPENERG